MKKKTQAEFINQLNLISPELKVVGEYKGHHSKILIEYNSHTYNIWCMDLLQGAKPNISSCIDKNKVFIEKAIKIHGNKYDYTKVKYLSSKDKVTITCSIHGDFEQNPINHINNKHGCPICNKSTDPWSYSKWEEKGLSSRNFTGFKIYIIECFNENEIFYKIGKTFSNLSVRFYGKNALPYQFKILKTVEGSARFICELESTLHKLNKNEKYIPKIKFKGMTECYSKINKEIYDGF